VRETRERIHVNIPARASRVFVRGTSTVVVDQAVSSASNFLLVVVVGRWLGPASLGVFALVIAGWLIAYGVFRAVVEDPMTVSGCEDRYAGYLGATAVVAIVGAGLLTVVALLLGPGTPRGETVAVLAVFLPMLFLQDFWRRVAFVEGRASAAVVNDLAFLVVQVFILVILIVSGRFSAPAAMLAWGTGGLVGAVLGVRQFRPAAPRLDSGLAALRAGRDISSWLVADFLLNRWSRQAALFIIASVVGASAVGGIQASVNLLGFTNIVILGASSAALARGSREMRTAGVSAMRRAVRTDVLAMTAIVATCAVVYALAGGWALRLVYGVRYASFSRIVPLVALQIFLVCLDTAPVTELRILRDTKSMFLTRACAIPFSLGAVWYLSSEYGATGGALGAALVAGGLAIGAWGALVVDSKVRRTTNARAGGPGDRAAGGPFDCDASLISIGADGPKPN
jgi:O-antigen/teichoic acid export membrane protein